MIFFSTMYYDTFAITNKFFLCNNFGVEFEQNARKAYDKVPLSEDSFGSFFTIPIQRLSGKKGYETSNKLKNYILDTHH